MTAPSVFRLMTSLAITGCAVLFTACTAEKPPSAGSVPRQIAACPLLTPDQVGQIIAAEVGDGEEREPVGGGENQGRMTACIWQEPSDTAGALVSLMVWSWPPGSGGAASYLESFRQAATEFEDMEEPRPISIGDEASWDGFSVHARTGDVSITVSVSKPAIDPSETQAESEAIVKAVLAKL